MTDRDQSPTSGLDCRNVRYAGHAFQRMFERGIAPAAIERILMRGEVIMSYPDDKPFPSVLLLGFKRGKALHVVAAKDPTTGDCVIVTAYHPSPALWEAGFRTRRK